MKRHIHHSTVQPPANACARLRAITNRQRAMHVVLTRHGMATMGYMSSWSLRKLLLFSFLLKYLDLMYIITFQIQREIFLNNKKRRYELLNSTVLPMHTAHEHDTIHRIQSELPRSDATISPRLVYLVFRHKVACHLQKLCGRPVMNGYVGGRSRFCGSSFQLLAFPTTL